MTTETHDKPAELLEALNSADKPTIRAAVDALIRLAAESPDLSATLNQLLVDPHCQNRWAVAYVLAHRPPPSDNALRALLAGLDHREPDVRWAIALLLVRLATQEKTIVHALLQLCAIGTAAQKRMAIYCLRDLQLVDEVSLRTLFKLLEDADPTVRVSAVTSLRRRDDMNAAGREKLLELFLDDPDARVRSAAAVTLAQLGAPSKEFLSALERACESDVPQIKKAALAALAILQK